jgi:DNA invertase Pin-like site-specific DNA recombinase
MQHNGKYVTYYRVSTSRQGVSGLGLDAQRRTVEERLNGGRWKIVAEYTEVETGTNKRKRPTLDEALATCRLHKARLIVANVSRLTRDTDFLTRLRDANVEVEFCDLPNVDGPVGKFMLNQMVNVAELEAGMISERTRKALQAARERGRKLGGDRGNLPSVAAEGRANSLATRQAKATQRATDLKPIIAALQKKGINTAAEIARELTERGIPTARGGSEWQIVQVQRVLARM